MPNRSTPLALLLICSVAACDLPGDGGFATPGPEAAVSPVPRGEAVERPRTPASFPLASAGYARGAATAPLTIYEISDFGCRFCGVFAREELPVLRREFIDSERVRWIFIPTEGASPNGARAARAAVCAGEQDHFWEMHDLLFADQRAWMRPRDPDAVLSELARRAGLDVEAFSRCYADEEVRARLQGASRLSLLLGVRATPSFFVDGRLVEGALRAPQFAALIRRLEASAAAVPHEADS